MENKLKEEIMKRAVGGKLACATARSIAEELHVAYKEVGEAADELGVKIKNCELGCF
jgi:peptide subunit release factor 1 (eRF1)